MFDSMSDGTLKHVVDISSWIALLSGGVALLAGLAAFTAGFASKELGRRSDAAVEGARLQAARANQKAAEADERAQTAGASAGRAFERAGLANREAAAANERAAGLEVRSRELAVRLQEARDAVGARTITPEDVHLFQGIKSECGLGVAVQAFDQDAEVQSFKFNVEMIVHEVGLRLFPLEIPTLEAGEGGADVTIWLPGNRATALDRADASHLAKAFRHLGFSVGAATPATMIPRGVTRNDELDERGAVEPPFCILIVHRRPPDRLGRVPFWSGRATEYYSNLKPGEWPRGNHILAPDAHGSTSLPDYLRNHPHLQRR